MSDFAWFLDFDYIYREGGLDRNIDPLRIRKFVKRAQDEDIYNLIGGELYNKILDLINGDTLSSSGIYKTLVNEYIAPVIVFQTVYYFSSEDIHLTNKGLQEKSSDYSNPPSDSRRLDINNRLLNDIDVKRGRLINFLIDNKDSIPEFDWNKCVPKDNYILKNWLR